MKSITKKVCFGLITFIFILLLPDCVILIGEKIWKPVYRTLSRHNREYFTIYVIGESTSVGQPFQPILSYPEILSRCFNDSILGKPIEIINLSRAGMTLEWHYWELQRELLIRPRSGCLLIYSGINENIDNKPTPLSPLQEFSVHSFLIAKSLYLLRLPNSLTKYKQCLQQTMQLGQSYNLPTVVSTLVGNHSAFAPDVLWDEKEMLQTLPTENLLMSAYKEEEQKNWDCALEHYTNINHSLPKTIPFINYKIGKCLLNMNRSEEARFYFTQAIDSGISWVPATWKSDAIRETALANNAYLIEPLPVFEKLSSRGITDYELFMDAHHPNIKGYQVLADEFGKAIARIYHIPDKKDCTSEQILNSFNIQNSDECTFYLRSAIWHICLCSATNEPAERIISASDFLEKARQVDPTNPEIIIYGGVVSLLKKDLDEFKQIMSIDSVWLNNKLVSESFVKIFCGKEKEIAVNTLSFWDDEGKITCQEFNKLISRFYIADSKKTCTN